MVILAICAKRHVITILGVKGRRKPVYRSPQIPGFKEGVYLSESHLTFFQGITKTIGLRMDPLEERLGADFVEHDIGVDTDSLVASLSRPSIVRHALDTGKHYSQQLHAMPSVINVEDEEWDIRVTRKDSMRRRSKADISQLPYTIEQ